MSLEFLCYVMLDLQQREPDHRCYFIFCASLLRLLLLLKIIKERFKKNFTSMIKYL